MNKCVWIGCITVAVIASLVSSHVFMRTVAQTVIAEAVDSRMETYGTSGRFFVVLPKHMKSTIVGIKITPLTKGMEYDTVMARDGSVCGIHVKFHPGISAHVAEMEGYVSDGAMVSIVRKKVVLERHHSMGLIEMDGIKIDHQAERDTF